MILIINKSKKEARGLSDMFYYMGILAYGVTPTEALSEVSPIYRAIILMSPDNLPDKDDYVARLRSYSQIPIFAMTASHDNHDVILFDGILKKGTYAAYIYKFICDYSYKYGTKLPGSYHLSGINASCDNNAPLYFFKALPFTKTETMILRTLIRTYPRPTSAKEILKYAFRPSKIPDISNIRTHVSIMNKKFREATGRNIITYEIGEGYRVLTPEIIDSLITV